VRLSSLKPRVSHPAQYALQLAQVFFVGLTLGMTRTVVPAVAESDFGVRRGDLALVAAFIIAFGLVKGAMNLVAGAMSERFGRRRMLIIGWLAALPVPWMIWHAPNWEWVVASTVLLGVNQGLSWSMSLTSKLDLTRPEQRGLTNGLNEFFGYCAMALAGVATGYLSKWLGARTGLLVFGVAATVPPLILARAFVRDTRDMGLRATTTDVAPRSNDGMPLPASCRRRTFVSVCQCGLFEKFVDVLMWLALPVFLTSRGVGMGEIGWVPGIYALVWGASQVFTGPLSDHLGRKVMISGGMALCAAGVALLPEFASGWWWWGGCAAAIGLGMAMLYPTLGAAVSDLAPPGSLGKSLGVYRFWRDAGYAAGGVSLAVALHSGVDLVGCFRLVAVVVLVSGLGVWIFGAETAPMRRPRIVTHALTRT
jgi:MFS family permease